VYNIVLTFEKSFLEKEAEETLHDKLLLSHMLQRRLVNFQTIPDGRQLIS
jgi:hypothetical protein